MAEEEEDKSDAKNILPPELFTFVLINLSNCDTQIKSGRKTRG